MSTRAVVERFREAGVLLGLRAGEVHFLAEPGRLTPEVRSRLRAERTRIVQELSGANVPAGGDAWAVLVERELRGAALRVGVEVDDDSFADRAHAAVERAANLEIDAGLSREEAEEQALEAALGAVVAPRFEPDAAAPKPFTAVCDITAPRHPHDPPPRGCYSCDGREFVRVGTGPAWFCPRCRPPMPGGEIVERWTAPESGRWGARRA